MIDTNFITVPGQQEQLQSGQLEAALEYARRNIPIFPVTPHGKLPVVKWGSEATTDLEKIKAWWQQNPDFNIGLVTGAKSGIVVVDFDTEEAWTKGNELGLPSGPLWTVSVLRSSERKTPVVGLIGFHGVSDSLTAVIAASTLGLLGTFTTIGIIFYQYIRTLVKPHQ